MTKKSINKTSWRSNVLLVWQSALWFQLNEALQNFQVKNLKKFRRKSIRGSNFELQRKFVLVGRGQAGNQIALGELDVPGDDSLQSLIFF